MVARLRSSNTLLCVYFVIYITELGVFSYNIGFVRVDFFGLERMFYLKFVPIAKW